MAHFSPYFTFPFGGDLTGGKNLTDKINAQFFGVDLLFTNDLHVTPKGDWQIIDGLENLRQAIYRRLQVKPGEFRVRPDYGVGVASYVKKAMPKSRIDELRQRIITQLAKDKRIDRVVSVEVFPSTGADGAVLKIRITVAVLGVTVRFKPFSFAEEQ